MGKAERSLAVVAERPVAGGTWREVPQEALLFLAGLRVQDRVRAARLRLLRGVATGALLLARALVVDAAPGTQLRRRVLEVRGRPRTLGRVGLVGDLVGVYFEVGFGSGEEGGLETLQAEHDDGDVVEGLPEDGQLHYVLDGDAAELVKGAEAGAVASGVPDALDDVVVGEPVEDAVA